MLSDEWLPRYRLLENFNIKWNGNDNAQGNGNGNAYDRGDYNSSFALRAVELKRALDNNDLIHICTYEPCHEKTDFLHMRKQKCRSTEW